MKPWAVFLRVVLQSRWAFRGDWALGVLSEAVTAGIGLVMVLAVTSQAPLLAGSSRDELLVCWGVAEVARGLAWSLGRGLYGFNAGYLVEGGLDRLLLRPLHPLGQVLVAHIHLGSWPSLVWGLGAIVVGRGGLSALEVLQVAMGAGCGALVLLGVLVGLSSVGFWWPHRGSSVGLAWQATAFAPYPPSVLPWPVALALTTLLPFTFVGYAPGAWLMDRPVPWWVWLQPGVAALCALVGLTAWQVGLRRYGSAGS